MYLDAWQNVTQYNYVLKSWQYKNVGIFYFYSRAAASLRLLWVQGAEGDDTIGFFDHVYFKFEMPCNYLGSFGQFENFWKFFQYFPNFLDALQLQSS